jgi:HEAT repeat protein
MNRDRTITHAQTGMITRLALATTTLALLLLTAASAADPAQRTKDLVTVLRSDAPLFDKARACQQLGEIGTAEAVPVLAGLLADPKLSAYARSGLEGIPHPSAAAALRNTAQTLRGPLLIGVVNSLGALRDAPAVDVLIKLATDADSGARREAFLALGNIATPDAVRFLQRQLGSDNEAVRAEVAGACLLAAERLRSENDLDQAFGLYHTIRTASVPLAYRVGAARGAILARKADRVLFLVQQLRSDEPAIRNAALLTIREVKSEELANVLNAEIVDAGPELQQQLLWALADCHNAQSIGVAAALGASGQPDVRKTALTVLGRMGPEAAPALLAALEREGPTEEKTAALSALRALDGAAVDGQILQSLRSANTPQTQTDLIRLLEARGATSATPELLRQASALHAQVRVAALEALKSLARPSDLPPLVALIKKSGEESFREAAESAIASVCDRAGEPGCELILTELKQTEKPTDRISWIRVLARVGYPQALPALEAAARDSDLRVAENAVSELGRWPTPAPMETLLGVLESGASQGLRKRALASVLDLASTAVDEAQTPPAAVVDWLKRTNPTAQSAQDKLRVVSLLGRLKTAESFRLLTPLMADSAVEAEAAAAIVQIAPALTKSAEAPALRTALDRIAANASSTDLKKKAQQIVKTIPARREPVSLFDGQSLQGWEGNTNVWRVQEGVIVGGSMKGNPKNEFLATLRSYTNFVLRLEYKLVGTEGFVNGGVQFRSVRVANPPNEMSGYQADIGAGYSGALYDESRRNKMLVRPNEELVKRLEKAGDWNRYEIRCEGSHIQLWLNGEKTVEYAEPDAGIPQTGVIALQIHGDCKAEIYFRNLVLEEL